MMRRIFKHHFHYIFIAVQLNFDTPPRVHNPNNNKYDSIMILYYCSINFS